MENPESVKSALRTIQTENRGLSALAEAIAGPISSDFAKAVETLKNIKGRLIVTGVGKSGHIGNKMAATFASTGTPAHFVHSAEANHGDLGMITRDDVILGLSRSGETTEFKGILAYASRFSIPLIAITSNGQSALGKVANICLTMPDVEEACPHGLAPTTSTMMQLALGDALAVSLLEARGFSASDFGVYHPGGSLGASLTYVSEVMHSGDRLPKVTTDTSMAEAILQITEKSFGCVGVVGSDGLLAGIITDGDLRRQYSNSMLSQNAGEVMTPNPLTTNPDALASSAMAMLNEKSRTALMVTDHGKYIGIVHLHDLLRIGLG
ncbi:MAG: KpsF/GutQ family sugar-phosphate isomerase [Rhizobiaceae bacterium]|nr:KpsF/GutQ family sugar-phosphate isomerase [Rhizobiaceae bacterium]